MADLKDSGFRKTFASGAVRDTPTGKGRCDLMDLDYASMLLDGDPVLKLIDDFLNDKNPDMLLLAGMCFADKHYPDRKTALLELSQHFEQGADKYSPNNWKGGIDLHCYIDSAVRHYLKFLRGDTDEPHDRAFLWNIMCGRWTLLNRPEVDDIDASYSKVSA